MSSFFPNVATLPHWLYVIAILLGIFLPQGSFVSIFLILPALTVILTVTLLRYPKGFFRNPKRLIPSGLLGNLMNYLVFGNLIILGSIFFIRDEKLWIGMILIAAMPPAFILLSVSDRISADRQLTLGGFAGVHAAAVVLIPLIGVAFLKFIPISYPKLIVLILSLIALPLILSRLIVDRNLEDTIQRQSGITTNICHFLIYYTLAAHCADLIPQRPFEALLIFAIGLAAMGIVILGFFLLRKFFPIDNHRLLALLLLGTMKNYGMAGVIGLYIFGKDTALPALILSVLMFVSCIGLIGKEKLSAEFFKTPDIE
jgi:BASS family bile acid:Na+ symporter